MSFCHRTNRREFISTVGGGFTQVALAGMLAKEGFFSKAQAATLASGIPEKHFPAKAKSVIFLFMYGGPSHIDTFDHKPKMKGLDGKTIAVKTHGRGGKKNEGRIVEPKWDFHQHGQCGKQVSTLFPHLAECVDDIAFIHSLQAESPIHGSAMLMMNSGSLVGGKPSLGSWVNYGLGNINENLPGYVVMLDTTGGPISGAKNWSSGFMPANYQGTVFRSKGDPILDLKNTNGMGGDEQYRLIQSLNQLNEHHLEDRYGDSNLAARISSYELAYKMQSTAPEAIELAQESDATKSLYGMDQEVTSDFGKKCLLARRLVERGVPFIQLYSGGAHNDNNWDAHGDLVTNHERHAGRTDKPIAGLLKDLKVRGLLDETLVVWGGEFGRPPDNGKRDGGANYGRDHNSNAMTMWLAGGGTKAGHTIGATDDIGNEAVDCVHHIRDVHCTLLHLLGLDDNKLTYYHAGRHKQLSQFGGQIIPQLLA